ncbi:hypothetical protein BD410DRAFT_900101 [Rickenella mellea]|uniref:MYND-type domain-containing protein n=1 Tax=Rickenella mellea TaxID=50990 RepID=A0A4Y7PWR6_9AGAM|nr:hypothetical protein BD410DRAFT_900101 [Rickenella mellea]
MTGHGKEHKAKRKPSPTKPSTSGNPRRDAFADDIDNADGWTSTAALLCSIFELPDLSTRSGLKKVHKNFLEIYKRLDNAYTRNIENDRIVGGIVGIYAKMCADSLLRDRLFKQDFLSKIFPLLDRPSCCYVVLEALCNVTHHGGAEVRLAIAKKASPLIRLLEEQPNNTETCELAIVVLSHVGLAVVNNEAPPDPKLKKALEIPALLRVMVDQLKKPTATRHLIGHAFAFITGAAQHCSEEMFACPLVVDLLVASLRSEDMRTRCAAFAGITDLCIARCEEDCMLSDPRVRLAALQRGFPPHLDRALMAYGPERIDTTIWLNVSAQYQKAMMRVAQDRDMYTLGQTLAQLIPKVEHSIGAGAYQTQDPRTGKFEIDDMGMPFKTWGDALPMCAESIRTTHPDEADMLDCKYLVTQGRQPDAHIIALRAIKRSPLNGFFYYICSLTGDEADGLRMAKKGLKCPHLTNYVRFGLLYRAVEHAGLMGIRTLQGSMGDRNKWVEGSAFVKSAWEDAKLFAEKAPPDTRNMKNALYWYNLLSFVLHGFEISADLHELEFGIGALQIADDITVFFSEKQPSKTRMRLSHELVMKRMASAAKDWDKIVEHCATQTLPGDADATSTQNTKLEDNLAAWLDEMHLDGDDGEDSSHDHCLHGQGHGSDQQERITKVDNNDLELYRCSWCRNPSAALKKCSSCGRARYCDGGCQKAHWKKHKRFCKAT